MQSSSNIVDVTVLGNFDDTLKAAPLKPFDDTVLEFFNSLSKRLTKVREYSDVVTFGFWCRKAALLKEKANYDDLGVRLGRGVVFHSTPSNVPVNFAYSFAAGLLAGNANIVRLPGKDFEQVSIIVDAVRELLNGDHADIAPYVCFVKYPPHKDQNDLYASVCDVRIVWGGDATISEFRESPLKPRAKELTFADRYSIAVINADEYLKAADKTKIAQDFYNDTYFSDQNACTSPRIVFWLGEKKEEAKKVFWQSVDVLAREKYELAPVQAVGKLAAFYKAAAAGNVKRSAAGGVFSSRTSGYSKPSLVAVAPPEGETKKYHPSHDHTEDNYITRVKVTNADNDLMDFKYNSGFFFEQDIESLEDILPICGERLQTLTYYGLTKTEISSFISEFKPKGIDRAVPLGKSMDFSLTWDGYDLIRELSRKVVLI